MNINQYVTRGLEHSLVIPSGIPGFQLVGNAIMFAQEQRVDHSGERGRVCAVAADRE
jgi:hypothetical protein